MDDKIKNIIAKNLDIDVSTIKNDTSLNLLAEDSMSRLELVFELEDELDVHIPHDSFDNIETVGDLVSLLQSLKKC
jgi:acyl carrier protein